MPHNLTLIVNAALCALILGYILAPALKLRNWHTFLHAFGVGVCALALFIWAATPILMLP